MRETDPIIELRIEEILDIRLDAAKEWDIRRYVAEKEAADEAPWKLAEGGNPLSRRQIRNYIREADRRMARSTQATRRRRIARHIAFREKLFARAVNSGDLRTALAILDSLAKLQDLFPSEADKLTRESERLRRQMEEMKGAKSGDRSGSQEGVERAHAPGEGPPQSAP
jgi:hypothetical protein